LTFQTSGADHAQAHGCAECKDEREKERECLQRIPELALLVPGIERQFVYTGGRLNALDHWTFVIAGCAANKLITVARADAHSDDAVTDGARHVAIATVCNVEVNLLPELVEHIAMTAMRRPTEAAENVVVFERPICG
jgi:hypothetical protein